MSKKKPRPAPVTLIISENDHAIAGAAIGSHIEPAKNPPTPGGLWMSIPVAAVVVEKPKPTEERK